MPLDPSLSPARLAANRANAQLSTGPKSESGKAVVSQNRWRHGLSGAFLLLPWEVEEDFEKLRADLRAEHKPSTFTENLLVDRMAQHHWLLQRALLMQQLCFNHQTPDCEEPKELALYPPLPDHPRARLPQMPQRVNQAQNRSSPRQSGRSRRAGKERIGFESQKRAVANDARKQAAEKRAETLHVGRLELLECQIVAQKARVPQPKLAEPAAVGLKQAA